MILPVLGILISIIVVIYVAVHIIAYIDYYRSKDKFTDDDFQSFLRMQENVRYSQEVSRRSNHEFFDLDCLKKTKGISGE